MIIAKKINLYRNIADYKFVWKESIENLKKLEKEIVNFISKNFKTHKDINNLFIHKDNENITIQINEVNHIKISLIDFSNSELKNSIDKIFRIENEISNFIPFAYSRDFGYLTPYLKYIPHAIELEYFITTQYLEKEGSKYIIIKNLTNQGYDIEERYKTIKIAATPTYQDSLKDFLNKTESVLNTIEKKEIESFENCFQTKKIILNDKIKKILGYISNSTVMEYYESIKILIFLLHISQVTEYLKLDREKISKLILNIKNSSKISDLKQNSKEIKNLVKEYL